MQDHYYLIITFNVCLNTLAKTDNNIVTYIYIHIHTTYTCMKPNIYVEYE